MQAGDLCSIEKGDGAYGVAKILRVEEGVVHVRVYAETFSERPVAVDPASLTLATVHDESFGFGHLPLHPSEFERWQPERFGHAPVEPEELDGYEIWRDAADGGEAGVWLPTDEPHGWRERLRNFFWRG